ncbi:MAG: sensor histidine kinase, partial [Gaiellaceae bacterium]
VLNQARAIKGHPAIATVPGVLSLVHAIAGFESESVIVIDSDGTLVSKAPPNLSADANRTKRLVDGKVVSGALNHIAYAAVPLFSTDPTKEAEARTVALVFESRETFPVANVLYFALAGFISLVVAAAFSIEISRRISRHVKAAADAARRVARGDFSARMDAPGHGYPELVELQDSLNLMAHDLERSREAEREFLLSISHELRTPLTSIRGYAEAIAEGAVSAPDHAARVVVTESDRLARLIEDLLSMARLSAHQFTFRVRGCDLTATVVRAAESLRFAFEQSGVELKISAPDTSLVGNTDEDRLSQIVSNLVENALKYASELVDVVITHEAGRGLVVAV